MKKILSAILLSVCVVLSIAGAVEAQVKGTSFDNAIAITELEHAYEVKLQSTSSEDDRYYSFVPSETGSYLLCAQPNGQFMYVSMRSSREIKDHIDGRSVWVASIEDFGTVYELQAGHTYYLRVSSASGPINGIITFSRYEGTLPNPYLGEMLGEVILDIREFQKAVQLSETDVEYKWQIEHVFGEEDGMLTIDFDEKYYKIVPAQTATYKIVSKPDFYDSYMSLFLIDEEEGPVQVELPWGEVERELYLGESMGGLIFDYVIETELVAGKTYCIKLSSTEGGTGSLIITGGNLNQGESIPVVSQPGAKTLSTTVGVAGYTAGGTAKDMPACYYKGGDTFMPIRMLQDLGVGFDWNEATKTATMAYGSKTIQLTIGSTDAYVNEVKTSIVGASGKLVAPELAPGRTMIPLRFVSEQLGFTVHWDPSNLITISLP